MIFKITSEDLFFNPATYENEELAADNVAKICRERATEIYGEMRSVADRLEVELAMMRHTECGFLFMLLREIVRFSENLGYPIMATGNFSSSLISFLLGITNINPLPAHYRCDSDCYRCLQKGEGCRFGLDMSDNYCSTCGKLMLKDGFDISAITVWDSFVDPVTPEFSIKLAPSVLELLQKHLNDKLGYVDSDRSVYKRIEIGESAVCEDIGKLAKITGKSPVNKQYSNEIYLSILKMLAKEISEESIYEDVEEVCEKINGMNECDFLTLVQTYCYKVNGEFAVREDILSDCISRLQLMCTLAWYEKRFPTEFDSL